MWLMACGCAAQAQVFGFSTAPRELAQAVLGKLQGEADAAVWRDGQARFAGLRGGASWESDTEPEHPVLYEIGSISKVFTGLLLAQAVERGDLSLNDSLADLLRGHVQFRHRNTAQITLGQLVTHTSCLPRLPADFLQSASEDDPYRGYDRARLWTTLSQWHVASPAPCAPQYSNWGFAILGEVLSLREGKPWHELVRERITAPLGMTNTRQHLADKAKWLANGFAGSKPAPPWEMEAFAGAGALRSTAADLLRFGRALLAGRLGPLGAAAERVTTPLARYDGQIGYALFMRGPANKRTLMHNGSTGGYRAQLMLAADTGEVLVMLASNAQADVERVVRDGLSQRYPVAAPQASVAAGPLSDYAGVFREGPRSALTFLVQDGVLYGHSTGLGFVPMACIGEDLFMLGPVGQVQFKRHAGQVTEAILSSRGAETSGRRTNEPVPAKAVLPDEALQPLVGRYRTPAAVVEVTVSAGQLLVRYGEQPRFVVYAVAGDADRFAYDVAPVQLQFQRYGNGQVHTLLLHQNGTLRAQRLD